MQSQKKKLSDRILPSYLFRKRTKNLESKTYIDQTVSIYSVKKINVQGRNISIHTTLVNPPYP